jgi:GT2 family glycosyltransferase
LELKSLKTPFKLKFIKGIEREKPLVVGNMNMAIKECEGLFIVLFADTYLGKDALKNLTETYIPNSYGTSYKINVTEKGKFISNHFPYESDEVLNVMAKEKSWEYFSGNGMIATKEIMERIGYKDENYGGYGIDDYDTALCALMNGSLLYVYHNVKLYHIDHPTKESSPENIKRFMDKLTGRGIVMK